MKGKFPLEASLSTLLSNQKPKPSRAVSISSIMRRQISAGPIFVKGVSDANPNAVDKCLDALLAFLQNTNEAQASRSAASYLMHLHV